MVGFVSMGTAQSKAPASPFVTTLSLAGAAVGERVVVCIANITAANTVTAVTDSKGNVYTQDVAGNTNATVALWSSVITTALTTTDTVSVTLSTTGTAIAVSVIDVTGLPYAVLDRTDGNGSASGTSVTVLTAFTTRAALEAVICVVAAVGPSGDGVPTPGAGFAIIGRVGTTGGAATTNITGDPEDQALTAITTFAAGAVLMTLATARKFQDVVATYMTVAPPVQMQRAMRGSRLPPPRRRPIASAFPWPQAAAPTPPAFTGWFRRPFEVHLRLFTRRGKVSEPPWGQAAVNTNQPVLLSWWGWRRMTRLGLRRGVVALIPAAPDALGPALIPRRSRLAPAVRRGKSLEPPWGQVVGPANPDFVEWKRPHPILQLRAWQRRGKVSEPPWGQAAVNTNQPVLSSWWGWRRITRLGLRRGVVTVVPAPPDTVVPLPPGRRFRVVGWPRRALTQWAVPPVIVSPPSAGGAPTLACLGVGQ